MTTGVEGLLLAAQNFRGACSDINIEIPIESMGDRFEAISNAISILRDESKQQLRQLHQKLKNLSPKVKALFKAATASLHTAVRKVFFARAPRHSAHTSVGAKRSGNKGSDASDGDGPPPHSHRLSLPLRAFSAQFTSVLEVLK